jgi:hypothetical protein
VVGGSLVEAQAVESVVVVLLREAASVPFGFAVLLWETARCSVVCSGSVPTHDLHQLVQLFT